MTFGFFFPWEILNKYLTQLFQFISSFIFSFHSSSRRWSFSNAVTISRFKFPPSLLSSPRRAAPCPIFSAYSPEACCNVLYDLAPVPCALEHFLTFFFLLDSFGYSPFYSSGVFVSTVLSFPEYQISHSTHLLVFLKLIFTLVMCFEGCFGFSYLQS